MTYDCSVLVVGAGPTGLTLANELTRHGVQCRIIDKSLVASQATKALGIQARTLELFEKMGLAETALTQGIEVTLFNIYSEGKPIAHFDLSSLDSPYPWMLMLPQNSTESLLHTRLTDQGIQVERGVELVSLTQQEREVEVVLRKADGSEERVRTEWLVGCDGTHSVVRHQLGFEFVGDSFEESFTVADVRMHWSLPMDQVFAFLHRGDFIAFFPMSGGRHRIALAHNTRVTPTGEVTLQEIQEGIDLYGPPGARASEPASTARFRINQRKANHYAQGRVFLAGDAAHIHSLIGAQGMNTGIQDAFNLAWKLALVIQGRAPEVFLKSYELERAAVGERLVRGTRRITRMTLMRHALTVTAREYIAPLILSRPRVRQSIAESIAETDISYRHSSIVREQGSNRQKTLQAGDRALDGFIQVEHKASPMRLFELLSQTRQVLLIFSGHQSTNERNRQWQAISALIADGYQEGIDVYRVLPGMTKDPKGETVKVLYDADETLHQRYGIDNDGLVLIRPDGYIGFRSQPITVESLRAYLEEYFLPQR